MKQLLLAWKPPTEQEIVPKVSRNKNTTKAKLNGPTLGKSAPKKRLTTLKPVFPALLRRQHRQHLKLRQIVRRNPRRGRTARKFRLVEEQLALHSAHDKLRRRLLTGASDLFG